MYLTYPQPFYCRLQTSLKSYRNTFLMYDQL